jgi:hypothetical protein
MISMDTMIRFLGEEQESISPEISPELILAYSNKFREVSANRKNRKQ